MTWAVSTQPLKPARCRNFRLPELPTLVGTSDKPKLENIEKVDVPKHIPNTFGMHTRQLSHSKRVSSGVSLSLKPHIGWLKHLWIIIYEHDAFLLIVRLSYLLKIKWKRNLNLLSWSLSNRSDVLQSSSSEGANMSTLIFSFEHSHLEHVDSIQ
jgi:hypothetical protein